MSKRNKFLLDENLERLAKWLRMLGYDTIVPKSISIEKKISLCIKERRIFLTRNKKIAKRSEPYIRFFMKEQTYLKQLSEMQDLISFDNKLSTRCLNCNYILQTIEPEYIKHLVPEKVLNYFSEFKICRKCGKIYWNGSHYDAMKMEFKNLLTTKVI